jgi:hypothetical protein
LRDLANDSAFDGTVVVEFNAIYLFGSTTDPSYDRDQIAREYVNHYHRQSIFNRFEYRLKSMAQRTLVCQLPELSATQIIPELAHSHHLPRPLYTHVREDRSRAVDFNHIAAQRYAAITRLYGTMAVLPPAEFLRRLQDVSGQVDRIRQRGGEVIFVRFPSSQNAEFVRTPRDLYWDPFAKQTGAPSIYFADYPALTRFDCPDGSHLDSREAPGFTRELIRILATKSGNPALAAASSR